MKFLFIFLIFIGTLFILMFIPVFLGWIIDPINIKRIKKYCKTQGIIVDKVDLFPNHYGVKYTQNGIKGYAKVTFKKKNICWKPTVLKENRNKEKYA